MPHHLTQELRAIDGEFFISIKPGAQQNPAFLQADDSESQLPGFRADNVELVRSQVGSGIQKQ